MVVDPEIRGLIAHAALVGFGRRDDLVAIDIIKPQNDFFAIGQLDRKAVAIGPIGLGQTAVFEFLQFLSERGRRDGEQQESDESLHETKLTQSPRPSQQSIWCADGFYGWT